MHSWGLLVREHCYAITQIQGMLQSYAMCIFMLHLLAEHAFVSVLNTKNTEPNWSSPSALTPNLHEISKSITLFSIQFLCS